jgi:hypothetical protein
LVSGEVVTVACAVNSAALCLLLTPHTVVFGMHQACIAEWCQLASWFGCSRPVTVAVVGHPQLDSTALLLTLSAAASPVIPCRPLLHLQP